MCALAIVNGFFNENKINFTKKNFRALIAARFMPGSTVSLDCKSKTKYIYLT